MKVSIIIPTYNEEEYLPNLLESIQRQDYEDIEVIIADANSTDNTKKIAEEYNCIIVDGGLPGVGRNKGAKKATGEILLFLDADSVLTDNYLNCAIDEFTQHNLGIAITQIVPLEKGFINELSHEFANYFTKQISKRKPHGAGCYGILTYKSLHEKVSGFDEKIDFGEDTDYIERIAQISRFKVLDTPRLLISTRRLEEEGLKTLAVKYTKSTAKQLAGDKVTLNDINYTFGHKKEKLKRKPRILYSLCGEGLGHAIRSAIVIEYLIRNNYDVIVFASDRAYEYLCTKFNNIHEINGFNTVYENNSVKNKKTFTYNMRDVPSDLQRNMSKMYKLAREFKPDVVVSDFEFYANLLSHILSIPLISLDNMHVITDARYKVSSKYMKDRIFAEAVVHAFIQKAKKTLIYSYFYPPLKDMKDTQYIKPLVREEIKKLKPTQKDYILVYQTSDSNEKLIELLKKNPDIEFRIYGFHEDKREDNLLFRAFTEEILYKDLKDARCVIANGGFSFITEALELKKPVLSIPVNKQFEQILNAIYIDRLGYGEHHDIITQNILDNFLKNVDTYHENIKQNYQTVPNSEILEVIKDTIDDVI